MAYTPEQVTQINTNRATAVDAGQNPYAGAGATTYSASQGMGAITPSSLVAPTPIVPPTVNTDSGATAITAATPALVAQQQQDAQLAADTAAKQEQVNGQKGLVGSLIDKITGVQTEQSTAEGDKNTPGTPAFLAETARNAGNKLLISQQAQVAETQALDSKLLTPEEKRAKLSEIGTRYGREQADLQLQYHLANSDYTAAEDTLNKKFQLELAPLQTQLQYQQSLYQDYENQLSDSQKTALSNKINETNTALQTETANKKEVSGVFNTLLQNNPAALKNNPGLAAKLSNATDALSAYKILADNNVGLMTPTNQVKLGGTVVQGTGGTYNADLYQVFNGISDTDGNKSQAQFGGLSKNGLLQDANLYLAENGKMPSLGLGSAPATQVKRDAIQNVAGAIADSLNLTLPQISAMYKANSTSATQIVNRVAKIDAASGALANQFPRLAELADKVKALGITETDVQAGAAKAQAKFGSKDAASYIELLQTIRGDYSAVQAAIGGSRGGEFFARQAQDAIPLGYTPDQYRALQQTIALSAINAQKGTQDEANRLIGNIGNPGGTTGSAPTPPSTTGAGGYDDYLKAIGLK